jgi:glycosyltransferase involved in cell wall biosynthesis
MSLAEGHRGVTQKKGRYGTAMIDNLCIVVPVYDDWASLNVLLSRLNAVAKSIESRIFVTVVDDGSIAKIDGSIEDLSALTSLQGIEIVHLAVNVGHQRAIAIGMCVAVEEDKRDAVLVMDGDGEDPPESIPILLAQAEGRSEFCIVAQRRRRHETIGFRLSYLLYKSLFRLLTGTEINFGNFSLTSSGYVRRLVMISELWNNLAAAILRSRLPVVKVPIDRGWRYAGNSKMNFVSLIVHGLSGISVYADAIFVRMLLLTIFLVSFAGVTIATVLFLRIFHPQYATPGWATTVSFGMIIILMQVFFTTISSILMLLNNRVQRLVLPILEYRPYIASRRLIAGRRVAAEPDKPAAG